MFTCVLWQLVGFDFSYLKAFETRVQFHKVKRIAKHKQILLSRNWLPPKKFYEVYIVANGSQLIFALAKVFAKQYFLSISFVKLGHGMFFVLSRKFV